MNLIKLAALVLSVVAFTGISQEHSTLSNVISHGDSTSAVKAELTRFTGGLWVHDEVRHKALVVFPVTQRDIRNNTNYITLDEAVESGLVKISEIDSGNVSTLRLEILTSEPMFFMAGEVITGAKQDRILQHDMIFRGKTGMVDLPVYCVEQGRWTSTSDKFEAGKILGTTKLRQAAAMKAGQHTIWSEVSSKNAQMSADTATGAFQASYKSEKFQKALNEYLDALRHIPSLDKGRISGAVIAVGGKIVSADLFANPTIFRKLWPKILKAAIADVVEAEQDSIAGNTTAREFLGSALKADIKPQSNPSQCEEYLLRGHNLQGNFVSSTNSVIHLALFTGIVSQRQEPIQIQQNQSNPVQQHWQYR